LTLSGPDLNQVSAAEEPVAKDCRFAIAVSPTGIVYYTNLAEIRRLVPPQTTDTPSASATG
jgi:hypothetical protein